MSNPLTTVTVLTASNKDNTYQAENQTFLTEYKTTNTPSVTEKHIYRTREDEPIRVENNPPTLYKYVGTTMTKVTPSRQNGTIHDPNVDNSIYTDTNNEFKYVSGYYNGSYTIGGNLNYENIITYNNEMHHAFCDTVNKTFFFVAGGNGGNAGISSRASNMNIIGNVIYGGGSGGGGGRVISLKIDYVANEFLSIDISNNKVDVYVSNSSKTKTTLSSYYIVNGNDGETGVQFVSEYSDEANQYKAKGGAGGDYGLNYGGDAATLIEKKGKIKRRNGKDGTGITVRFFDSGSKHRYTIYQVKQNINYNPNDFYNTTEKTTGRVNYINYSSYTKEIHRGGKGSDSGDLPNRPKAQNGAPGSFSLYYPAKKNVYGRFTIITESIK